MYQAKVDLDEHGMQGLVRDVKFRRNCGGGSLAIFGGLELMNQFFPALRHPIEQRLWKEARCLANPKLHRSSAALCHQLQEPLVFFWREVCVELLAKGGNHDFCGAGAPSARDIASGPPSFQKGKLSSPHSTAASAASGL